MVITPSDPAWSRLSPQVCSYIDYCIDKSALKHGCRPEDIEVAVECETETKNGRVIGRVKLVRTYKKGLQT